MIEIVAITDGHLGGGVDEQVVSKVVVSYVDRVKPSPDNATVAEAYRASRDALHVIRPDLERMRTDDGRNTS